MYKGNSIFFTHFSELQRLFSLVGQVERWGQAKRMGVVWQVGNLPT
jgi:hypothetical protein